MYLTCLQVPRENLSYISRWYENPKFKLEADEDKSGDSPGSIVDSDSSESSSAGSTAHEAQDPDYTIRGPLNEDTTDNTVDEETDDDDDSGEEDEDLQEVEESDDDEVILYSRQKVGRLYISEQVDLLGMLNENHNENFLKFLCMLSEFKTIDLK